MTTKRGVTRRKVTKPRTKTKPGNDTRYDKLYLLERVTSKTTWSIVTGQHEVKIGVTSKSAKERKDGVDLDLKGDVELVTWLYLPETAYRHEQRLLRKYGDRSFNPGGGAGAGNTEWLRVTWLTYIFILLDYSAIRYRVVLGFIQFLILAAAFFYAWLQTQV